MDTERTLYEIEVALAKSRYFDFRKNIIAFNVNGISSSLPIYHECDMLVCSKSGYLTEIEIKRSWSDFLADLKKKHHHESDGLIKYFYYCVPNSIYEKVKDYLFKEGVECAGIITYTEGLLIEIKAIKVPYWLDETRDCIGITNEGYRKLFIEQQLEVARLGAMRVVGLKEKINNIKCKDKDCGLYEEEICISK